jgi:hypothetical protein
LLVHPPRGWVGDAEFPLEVTGGYAFSVVHDEMDGEEPLPDRDVRFCEDGIRKRGEGVAAGVAVEYFGPFPVPVAYRFPAMGACHNAVIAGVKEVINCRFIRWKLLFKLPKGHTGSYYLGFHAREIKTDIPVVRINVYYIDMNTMK